MLTIISNYSKCFFYGVFLSLLILLAFIIIPILEIVVFLQTGTLIGFWPTLTIIIVTALVGSALLKKQGLSTLARFQKTVHNGELPLKEMFDGLFLLIAGMASRA